MGKSTNSLDWLLEEVEIDLENFRLVWLRYEKWFCNKLKLQKETRITDPLLKHEWIITNTHITLVQDDFQHRPYVKMDLSYYQAIVDDIKSSNEFRRSPEGLCLPKNKNKLASILERRGIWEFSR